MAKLTLTDIGTDSFQAISKYNENNAAIETALEKTLSRDGTGPNFMGAHLDMNSYRVINTGTPINNSDVATKAYVDSLVSGEAVIVPDPGGGGGGGGTTIIGGGITMETLADMQAMTDEDGLEDGVVVTLLGFNEANDGGGGLFLYSASASGTADGGNTFEHDSEPGRFLRLYESVINVKHYGAVGDGVTTGVDTPAFAAAFAAIPTAISWPGAKVYVPPGHYRLSAAITIPSYTRFVGAGRTATRIDFNDQVSGSSIILPSPSFLNSVEDMTIENSPGDTIDISGANQCRLVNLYIRWGGDDGIYIDDGSYMVNLENVFITAVTGYGMNVEGFCTSINTNVVFASDCGKSGFRFNDIIYSTFVNTSADTCTDHAFEITNCTGLTFITPAAEANKKSMFYFAASNTLAANAVGGTGGRYGYNKNITIIGAFGLSNATDAGATTASFITSSSLNSRANEIKLVNCRDIVDSTFQVGGVNVYASVPADVPTNSIVADGVTRITDDGSEFEKAISLTGSAYMWQENSVALPAYGEHFLGTNLDTYINSILVKRQSSAGTTLRGSTINSAFFNIITTPTTAGAMGMAFKTGDTNAAARDHGIYNGYSERGDFAFAQGTSQGANPYGGNLRLHIRANGNVGVGGTAAAPEALSVNGVIAIPDGVTAPGTSGGWAKLYVDAADGDLKIIYGNGVVKTIVVDT